MTKSLEDELNLPRIADALKQLGEEHEEYDENALEEITDTIEQMNVIRKSFNLSNFDENENKMTELQELAIAAHKDLLDAGYDVDPRIANNFFDPAMQSLNLAMETERTKIQQKLKLMQLQLEKEKVDLQRRKVELAERAAEGNTEDLERNAEGTFTARRDDLLKMLKEQDD